MNSSVRLFCAALITTVGAGSAVILPAFAASAGAAANTPLTIEQTLSARGMAPGAPAQQLDYSVTNPASQAQFVSAVTVAVTDVRVDGVSVFATDTGAVDHPTTCGPDDFTITQAATGGPTNQVGATFEVPAGATVTFHSGAGVDTATDRYATGLTMAMNNLDGVDQGGCRNAAVTLTFTAR